MKLYSMLLSNVKSVSHLNKDVPCYGEVGVFCFAEPLDEFLRRTNAVLVQQKSEDYTVS